ncbi:unnamed protein product [Toxocara canis]|uniref:Uncharacterized protein n=1 Tax=Toxocara canis TaxID=6265 RepID=A0A183V1N1_TOXCA|nr:unnamed protein product [Toxocara canis]
MPAPPILKRDWQKDHVYLIQFPRAGCIPTLSPFALKLETWLRITGINYSVEEMASFLSYDVIAVQFAVALSAKIVL